MRRLLAVLLGFVYVLGHVQQAAALAGKIYWTDFGEHAIRQANLDGSDPTTVVATGQSYPIGLALDASAGKLYWTQYGPPAPDPRLRRANLDGTGIEDLVIGLREPGGVALDPMHSQIYWAEGGGGDHPIPSRIKRSDLDGTNVHDVIITGQIPHQASDAPRHIAIDPTAGKVYWTNEKWEIWRVNFDGSGSQLLIRADVSGSTGYLEGIALDPAHDSLYWTSDARIQRSSLDGSGHQDVLTGVKGAIGLTLDLSAGKMYWACQIVPTPGATINRANLDGTHVEALVPIWAAFEIAVRSAEVPEPSTFALLAVGAISLLAYTWRRRRN